MKKSRVVIFFIAVIVIVLTIIVLSNVTYNAKVVIAGKTYKVDVAETRYFLERGLSGRESLKSNEGMFFIFQKPDKYGFWMKDMSFPIDIIWFDESLKVVHIEKNVKPETYPKVFTPESNSEYVLEVSSGQVDILNIKIGDRAEFLAKSSKNS